MYAVVKKKGHEKGTWLEIGAAWPHRDGKAYGREARLHPALAGRRIGHPRHRAEAGRRGRRLGPGEEGGTWSGPPFAGSAPLRWAVAAAFRSDFVGMKTSFVGILATPAGFEPATPSLEGWCSIRLSYGVLPGAGLPAPTL